MILINYLFATILPLGLISFLWKHKLNFHRDFPCIAISGIVWIYLHLAPCLCLQDSTPEVVATYAWLQFASIILFEAPFLFLYVRRMRHVAWPANRRVQEPERISNSLVATVSASLVFFGLIFLKVSVEHGVFFRRIGHEGLARRSLEIPFAELFVYRSYSELGVFATIFLLYLLSRRFTRTIFQGRVLTCTLIFHLLLYGFYIHINNRYQVGLLYLFVFFALRYWFTSAVKSKIFGAIAVVAFFLAVFLGMHIVSRSRTAMEASIIVSHSIGEAVTPWLFLRMFVFPGAYQVLEDASVRTEGGPLRVRLNGLQLMALITKPAMERGFMWGKAWIKPLLLYYYLVVEPSRYRVIKMGMETNAKVALISHYLDDGQPDYPSSLLTDAYGNFFLFGLVMAGLYFGWILPVVVRAFALGTLPGSTATLGMYVGPVVFYFEKELISQWSMVIRFGAPVALIWLAFRMTKYCKNRKGFPDFM